MIITSLTGGLGNQLFQYAAGKALAKERDTLLKISSRAYLHGKRSFELNKFNIQAKETWAVEEWLVKTFNSFSYLGDSYWSNHSDWLTPMFVDKVSDTLRQEFSLKKPLPANDKTVLAIHSSDSVSVHIRRSDYLEKQHRYIILSPEYYRKAMNILEKDINNPTYFFFSDDIEWVKKNIKTERAVFISDGYYSDAEELILMSMCKNNITANSTFSWWGAWLNRYPGKKIIAPEEWFTPDHQIKNLMPTDWIKI